MSNLLPEIPVFDPGGLGMSGVTSAGQGQQGLQTANSTVLHPPAEKAPDSSRMTSEEIQKILQENETLRERMKGLQSLGLLINESQAEALRLRQRVEDLGREPPPDDSFQRDPSLNNSSCAGATIPPGTASSKRYLRLEGGVSKAQPAMHEVPAAHPAVQLMDMSAQMQRMEDSIVHCATELAQSAAAAARRHSEPAAEPSDVAPPRAETDLSEHFARLAHKFYQLSGIVKQNSQKNTCMQVLCEKLASENEDLKKRLEGEPMQQRQTSEAQRRDCDRPPGERSDRSGGSDGDSDAGLREFHQLTAVPAAHTHKTGAYTAKPEKMIEKATDKAVCGDDAAVEVLSQKVRTLERQRKELLEVNKQWDDQFRNMKQQYEAKVVELRGRLSAAQKQVATAGEGQERRQREFDRTLVVAKNRLDREELERERLRKELAEETKRSKSTLEQLEAAVRHKELLQREVWRLNQSLAELLAVPSGGGSAAAQEPAVWHQAQARDTTSRQEELCTQIAVMQQQLKIYEEDFRKERGDRERMNAEKEELRLQLEQKVTENRLLRTQLASYEEDYKKEREEKERLQRQLRVQRQALEADHAPGPVEAAWTEPYGEFHYVVRYPPGDPRAAAGRPPSHAAPPLRSPAHMKLLHFSRDQRSMARPAGNPVLTPDLETDAAAAAAGSPEHQL